MPDGPRVYLLRSPSRPDPYLRRFAAAGWHAENVPALRFEFVSREALGRRLRYAARYGALILTSPRAVEALRLQLEREPDLAGPWRKKPAFVVGPRTGADVEELGFQPLGAESGRADELAEFIISEGPEGPLLFLAGNRSRDLLPERLADAGIEVDECVVYRTIVREDLPQMEAGSWVVFFSPSGVEAYERSGCRDLEVHRAAIGPTTAEALTERGLAPEAVAEHPDPDALLRAVEAARQPSA